MTDTRNTRSQLAEALSASRAAAKLRPKPVRDLATALYKDGMKNGFGGPLLAMGDALLLGADALMAEADRIKGDSPRGGDLEMRANRLLGIYEQVYSAIVVADATTE